ncbi:MAG: hypothetical protein A2Z03_05180 [Chloroflexi bacterium RBG_16_56_8]|nr:MAG: hypothetical protein A2Z03_05180 [Chloroflexi bacterium RBG_16_56_8]
MATTETEIKRLWREVEKLKKQVSELERKNGGKRRATLPRHASPERARVREILSDAGLLAELTPEEKARAAEWRALPEEEKQHVRDELWNLKLEKPLSQIIIENR